MADATTPEPSTAEPSTAEPTAPTSAAVAPRTPGGDVAAPAAYTSLIPVRTGLADFFAPVGGFGVTFSNLFRPTVTEQYPFEKVPTKPRYHGRHQLNRYADGLEKCIGCELCAWACPADAIYVEGADNTPTSSSRPASGTAASTRSTTCAASSVRCASRRARRAR